MLRLRPACFGNSNEGSESLARPIGGISRYSDSRHGRCAAIGRYERRYIHGSEYLLSCAFRHITAISQVNHIRHGIAERNSRNALPQVKGYIGKDDIGERHLAGRAVNYQLLALVLLVEPRIVAIYRKKPLSVECDGIFPVPCALAPALDIKGYGVYGIVVDAGVVDVICLGTGFCPLIITWKL